MFILTIEHFSDSEKAELMSYLDATEAELISKISGLNLACEQTVTDLYDDATLLSDGMMESLKKSYITWKLWSQTGKEDRADQARTEFYYYIETLTDKKNVAQKTANDSDLYKTKKLLYIDETD